MTSKISFPKLLKEDMKKRTWLVAVSVIVFMVVIPLLILFQMEGHLASPESLSPADFKEIKNWFIRMMEFDNLMVVPIMFGAVVSGITSFTYLQSKKQMDFYHSLPVKRETWFAVSYLSGIVQVMIPYIVGYLIIFAMGSAKGLTEPGMSGKIFHTLTVMFLFYLLVYSVAVLSMMVTGKIVVSIMGLAVFLFYGSAVAALESYIMNQAFSTYTDVGGYYGFIGKLFGNAGWFSPVLAYGKFAERHGNGEDTAKIVMVIAICALLCTVLAFLLYRIRPSEAAGKSIAFPKLEPVIKVVIGISAGIFFGMTAGSQNRTQGMNTGWLFGIGILSALLICAVIEFIYHTDMKLIFRKKVSLGIAVLGTVVILAAVKYDVFGYDTYFPKKEKLQAMAMDNSDVSANWAGCMYDERTTYQERLEALKTEQFDLLYALAQNGLEHVGAEPKESMEYVTVAYYLKSGRTAYRSYRVDDKVLTDCIERLMEDSKYRAKLFETDRLKEKEITKYQFSNFKQEETIMKLSKEQKEKLIETYKKEVESQPVSTFKNGTTIGELTFNFGEEVGKYYRGNIYKEYKELTTLLESYGYQVPDKLDAEDIKTVRINDYRNLAETEAEAATEMIKEVTEPEEIQKLLDEICYSDNGKTESNLYVEIAFKDGGYATYYLPK